MNRRYTLRLYCCAVCGGQSYTADARHPETHDILCNGCGASIDNLAMRQTYLRHRSRTAIIAEIMAMETERAE